MVEGLVDGDGVVPELLDEPLLPLEPGPPIELVPPDVSLLLVEPGVVLGVVPPPLALPPLALPPIALGLLGLLPPPGLPLLLLEVEVSRLGAGVVVDELDDVVGVPVWSRLVQAPSETAAINASAAHEVRDAFIKYSLRVVRK